MKFTNFSTTKQMSWLKVLLFGYAVIWTLSLLYCLTFYIFKCSADIDDVLMVAGASGFHFINMMVVQALKQSAVFSGLTIE